MSDSASASEAGVKEVHVAVAVIVRDGRVLIARRPDHVHQGGLLEFPGGKVEPGESVQAALVREIAEETQSADELRERLIESNQTQIEVDEPEEDSMALLMGAESDKPAEDDLSEEKLLRALMEAQGQG